MLPSIVYMEGMYAHNALVSQAFRNNNSMQRSINKFWMQWKQSI